MPDIPDRDELERQIARLLGRLNRQHLARLIELLGDPPDVNNVPDSFWLEAGEELRAALPPFGERVYLGAAGRLLENSVIGIDWTLVNTEAARWARQWADVLVQGITETSRTAVRESVANFFEQQQTLGQLRERLGSIFSPVRADLIASTEVTRAAVQGELAFADQIASQGIQMTAVWQTNNDERVCPICWPRHEKKYGDGWLDYPPAHPRCRCWINHEMQARP